MAGNRFLVLGGGSIGTRHVRNLRALGVDDIALFDIRPDRRLAAEKDFDIRGFADFDVALASGYNVALVCTPSRFHVEHALAAAKAGCHLFIEKPLAVDADGLANLEATVAEKRITTLIACNFRFHPGLRRLKDMLSDGTLGKVVSARARFGQYLPDWHPWEDYREGYSARRSMGGGVLLDRIHELDYMVWLLGLPRGVFAMLGKLSSLEIDTEDVADLLLRYDGGPIASVHLDYVRRTYDCGLEIIGDAGTANWTFQEHTLRWRRACDNGWHDEAWQDYDVNRMYLEELRHFLRVLDGEEKALCSLQEARVVLDILFAARRSATTGCEEPL